MLATFFPLPNFMVEFDAMETRAEEKLNRPLGVIGCLRAGFEVVGYNLWLVVPPTLLDLFLWLGPHLSVQPLVERFLAFLTTQAPSDPAATGQIAQFTELLRQMGAQLNLFSVLSGWPLLTVPSLLARHAPGLLSPLAPPPVWAVPEPFTLLLLTIALEGLGLALGAAYLTLLARRVAAARAPQRPSLPGRPDQQWINRSVPMGSGMLAQFVRTLVFSFALMAAVLIIVPIWLMILMVAMMVAPFVGILIWLGSVGLAAFVVAHLLFVVHGVLLGNRSLLRAIWESALLVRVQFPSVAGLMALIFVIYNGLGLVWSLPSADSWTLVVGILGNSCIATGLTAATFVFYQERIGVLPELLAARRTSLGLSSKLRL